MGCSFGARGSLVPNFSLFSLLIWNFFHFSLHYFSLWLLWSERVIFILFLCIPPVPISLRMVSPLVCGGYVLSIQQQDFPLLHDLRVPLSRGMATSFGLFKGLSISGICSAVIIAHFCSGLLFGCDSPFGGSFYPHVSRFDSSLVAALWGMYTYPRQYVLYRVIRVKGNKMLSL